MPIIIFVLIVVLVAQVGFWNTLSALLGAIGVIILLLVVLALLVWALMMYFWRRLKRTT